MLFRRSHHFREKKSEILKSSFIWLSGEREKIQFRFEHDVPEKPEGTEVESSGEEEDEKRRGREG